MADQVLVPKDRVVSRGRGCWNCIHWDRDKGKARWTRLRQNDLSRALTLALELPHEPKTADEATGMGQKAITFFNIKTMVDKLDHLTALGYVGACTGGGMTAHNQPVGDLVVHSYECHKWTGVSGAPTSAQGQDGLLPEELLARANEKPVTLELPASLKPKDEDGGEG